MRPQSQKLTFIDLFAGAGGLSEGFVRAGYKPLAHVEADTGAAFTLRTREAYHKLKARQKRGIYESYLKAEISREELYSIAFSRKPACVINSRIGEQELGSIFSKIDELSNYEKPDLIVGGPPCQAYSLVGRARSEHGMIGDYRNYLFVLYAEFLKRYKPKYFVFENVAGLLSARERNGVRYIDMMIDLFAEFGYSVEWRLLSADEYGVPQRRKRIILIGRRGRRGGFFPEIKESKTEYTVKDAINDLPKLKPGGGSPYAIKLRRKPSPWLRQAGVLSDNRSTTWHEARPHNNLDRRIFSEVIKRWEDCHERLNYNDLPNGLKTHANRNSFLDRFKVVAADLNASHTVVAHISKDGNYYIHPDVAQSRSLTPREAARLQTFPDDFFFESASGKPSRTAAFKQIGNAVPVLLAKKIAVALKDNWS